jgi:hypothetical protein
MRFTVTIDDATYRKLSTVAEERERSISKMAAMLIAEGLKPPQGNHNTGTSQNLTALTVSPPKKKIGLVRDEPQKLEWDPTGSYLMKSSGHEFTANPGVTACDLCQVTFGAHWKPEMESV